MNTAKLIQKEIKNKHLKLIFNKKIEFKPSQFIKVYDNKNNYAIYTIAQKTKEDLLELYITNANTGTIARYLNSLKINESINYEGPLGISKITKLSKNKLFFIALGSGIASYRALIYNQLEKRKITLIYINTNEKDTFYSNEFEKLDINYYQIITSKLKDRNETILLISSKLPKDKENYLFFVSGPPEATKNINNLLLKENIPKEQIIIN